MCWYDKYDTFPKIYVGVKFIFKFKIKCNFFTIFRIFLVCGTFVKKNILSEKFHTKKLFFKNKKWSCFYSDHKYI